MTRSTATDCQAFADALVLGTIEGGDDPSGLYWLARSQNAARRAVAAVTEFSDWLVEARGVAPVNPTRQATLAEQITVLAQPGDGARREACSSISVQRTGLRSSEYSPCCIHKRPQAGSARDGGQSLPRRHVLRPAPHRL